MKNTNYSFTNETDCTAITLNEDGEFVYAVSPLFWAVYDIDGKTLSAQFDCADNWSWYNDGGDGEDSEWTAKHYFDTDDQDFIDFLDNILAESKPSQNISTEEKADYLRENLEEDHPVFSLAEKVKEIVPEKTDDFSLLLAFYNADGISDVGYWECSMQISHDLSKEQTLALTQIF